MQQIRFMRLLLFFDLPMETNKEKKEYRHFRKKLIKNGFFMLQKSVYTKMVVDEQSNKAMIAKINSFLPPDGNIMILDITEKQFNDIKLLIGKTETDVVNSLDRIIEL